MKSKKTLIVFDLDGTLNRTECHAMPAILDGLREYGINTFSESDVIKTFGARDEDTSKLFFGDRADEIGDAFWTKVKNYSEVRYADCYRPYNKIPEVLCRLKELGYLTAVCSNAELSYIEFVTRKLNIYDQFDYFQPLVQGKTKDGTLKMLLESVQPEKAVMVGDRYFDMKAAKFNDIPFIACAYGFAEKDELKDADASIDEPVQLLGVLEKLLG